MVSETGLFSIPHKPSLSLAAIVFISFCLPVSSSRFAVELWILPLALLHFSFLLCSLIDQSKVEYISVSDPPEVMAICDYFFSKSLSFPA